MNYSLAGTLFISGGVVGHLFPKYQKKSLRRLKERLMREGKWE